jgi:hypothetical protein
MIKTLQVETSRGNTRAIVRLEEEVRRDYENLTWATLNRINMLTHNPKYRVVAVCLKGTIDIFIRAKE